MAVLRNSMSIYNVVIGHYTRLILLAISRVNLYYTNFKISIKLFCQLEIFYQANCSFINDIKLLPILCSLSTQVDMFNYDMNIKLCGHCLLLVTQ